ncbi:hypothetical protein IAT38_000431 [Cryptococcus sp. DSM 104549]
MKYLLGFLEDIPDAPNLTDPDFQQLLVDVQSVKGSVKISADAFYDSLENIVNELKASPESLAFQKPVSKREAPDYYEVIKRPMDLSTVMRNVKSRKYKSKADFAADLNLIWHNCYEYNSQETHPLRASARFMKQKADHHLEYLADRTERSKQLQALLPPTTGTASPAPGSSAGAGPSGPATGLAAGVSSRLRDEAGGDEDAAGESDDALGEGEEDGEGEREEGSEKQGFRDGGADVKGERKGTPNRGASRDARGRGTSVASSSRVNGRVNGVSRRSPSAVRPPLATTLDTAPALLRTPYTIPSLQSVSLTEAGPSFSDKGKAREILYGHAPPPWYPVASAGAAEDEESKLEGYWWGAMTGDEALLAGLPAVPYMARPEPVKRRRAKRPVVVPPLPNGIVNGHSDVPNGDASSSSHPAPPTSHDPSSPTKPLSVKNLVYRTVNNLNSMRQAMNKIHEFQRIENEGGLLPARSLEPTEEEKELEEEERHERRERRRAERVEADARRREGGEVGQEEAVGVVKQCAAGMLAHAGFEGANEMALDMFTRVAVDHLDGLGRTFRMLIDGFSNKMTPEELILHALHEQGQVEPRDLEAHLKDDIQRENVRVAEMQRKMRQAFKEIATAPTIEDNMMFADNGEMLLDGNFADELGEDFLGLRELGIDKEFGLSSLTIPQQVFYGRKKRLADAAQSGAKDSLLPYPPPPPFIPLTIQTLPSHLPALLHAFYAARHEAGLPLGEDDPFDPAHAQIGSLGQVVVKSGKGAGEKGGEKGKGKKREREEGEEEGGPGGGGGGGGAKKAGKKGAGGVGKGNWIRPSKEEKARRAAERLGLGPDGPGSTPGMTGSDDAAGEEDAEGEEE